MADNEEKSMFKGMGWMIAGCIIIAIVLLVLFLLHQTYDSKLPVDTGIFGTYGDFIGGVLGTVVALYSAYLLIKTFQNQAEINRDIQKTNESVIDANKSIMAANAKADIASQRQYYQTELQLFDNKFRIFLDLYQNAVGGYTYGDDYKGRVAFDNTVTDFIDQEFENNNDYRRRSNSATDDYLLLYAENQMQMSVHLRMLYLLVSLISNSSLEEDDKVQYAKLVRGQMSSTEMLIVRYNCRSHYGEKMQPYCNQYNLIKHLPTMSLLEFKAYRDTIKNAAPDEETAEKMLSSLNAMFITLRKRATGILYKEGEASEEYKTSHNYTVSLGISVDKKTFTLDFKKDKTGGRRGGGARISPDERGLDCLSEAELFSIFKDYLCELFLISNFDKYNRGAEVRQSGHTVSNANELSFKITVTNASALVLSHIQKEYRDNEGDELEA